MYVPLLLEKIPELSDLYLDHLLIALPLVYLVLLLLQLVLLVHRRLQCPLSIVLDQVALVLEQVLVVTVGVVHVAHELEHERDQVSSGDFVLDRHLERVLDPLGEEQAVVWEGQEVVEDLRVVFEGELDLVQVLQEVHRTVSLVHLDVLVGDSKKEKLLKGHIILWHVLTSLTFELFDDLFEVTSNTNVILTTN